SLYQRANELFPLFLGNVTEADYSSVYLSIRMLLPNLLARLHGLLHRGVAWRCIMIQDPLSIYYLFAADVKIRDIGFASAGDHLLASLVAASSLDLNRWLR